MPIRNNDTRGQFHQHFTRITSEDLKADRVHLNPEGMAKLLTLTKSDLAMAKRDCPTWLSSGGTAVESEMSMDETPLSSLTRSTRKTPLRKKRSHEESSEDDGKTTKKKKTNLNGN